ncbi:Protein of unknown function [Anaplasma phagocytophilum]|uniref:Uncharacterized protein n=1 Tax=Anaplasma phagocytophilum TaxID=948 RepID=A0A098EFM7_ANAPH|nr:Protein of unknown function [Anaplasma phagocytophilum]
MVRGESLVQKVPWYASDGEMSIMII